MTDEERIAYLAADRDDVPGPLDPGHVAELDEIRSLLADPAMWEVPGQHLEDTIAAAVADAAGRVPAGPRPAGNRPRGQVRSIPAARLPAARLPAARLPVARLPVASSRTGRGAGRGVRSSPGLGRPRRP